MASARRWRISADTVWRLIGSNVAWTAMSPLLPLIGRSLRDHRVNSC
jgi:hypothetical protein